MSDPSRSTDRLRTALDSAADELVFDPIEPTAIRGRAATRRRRRRLALGGGVTVVAVALVGAVVTERDNGDDTLELADPPETTQPDMTDDATTSVPSAPVTTPVTTPITTPPTMPPLAADAAPAIDGIHTDATGLAGDLMHLLPWRDGFLRIGIISRPQPLGPIPEEISALFPDEVLALFPDGLPPTIDEATAILSEAGLLDEVSAVLAEHPEASEAIYANEAPPPTIAASFTTDGEAWSTVEITAPVASPWATFMVSGDRLVTSSTGAAHDEGRVDVTIAWTDDLRTWQTETIEVAPVADAGSAPFQQQMHVGSLAVVGDRWIARVDRETWVDYESLLPDDVRAELATSEFGYGLSTNDPGITVEIERADGPPTTYEYTWDELGLDGHPESDGPVGGGASTLLVGEFGGDAEEIPLPAGLDGYGTVWASGSEFYHVGERVASSTDGRTWTPVGGLPADRYVNSVMSLTSGVLFVADGPDGAEAWLRSEGDDFTQVELPELGSRYGLWASNSTSAWIVDIGDAGYTEQSIDPITVAVQHDGFELTIVDGPEGSTYTLTDATTGELIVDQTVGPSADDRDAIWEFDETTGTPSAVIRDAVGTEVVRIPGDLISDAYQAALEIMEVTSAPDVEEWTPDFWLVATADGVDWLTLDLPDPTPDGDYWPTAAALNGRTVLYSTSDGWSLAEL